MASGDDKHTFSVKYNGVPGIFTFPKSLKVETALHKIEESFEEPQNSLTILHRGVPIPEDAPIEVALGGGTASAVTVIHVVKKNPTRARGPTTLKLLELHSKSESLHAYCVTCKSCVLARPVFLCKKCNKEGCFTRSSAEAIDYHAEDIPPELLRGTCTCSSEPTQARVVFECISCDEKPVAFLKSVRDNLHKVCCMKCEKTPETVVVWPCDFNHCLCLECFATFCKLQLGREHFKDFPGLGYSVRCPGPDDKCKASPIRDPHHFHLVDDPGDNTFYKKFKDMSIEEFVPSGDNIFCKCRKEIDLSSGKEVEVEDEAAVAGTGWFRKLLGIKPSKPPPLVRRKATCPECKCRV